MKTGVIIGRWQVPFLHDGHIHLINHVEKRSDKLVLVVGEPHIYFTNRNPLPFEIRKQILHEEFPNAEILRIQDNRSDQTWSDNLDKLLEGYENVTLYGSRDCFIERYKGKHNTKMVKSKGNFVGADIRREIGKVPLDDMGPEALTYFPLGVIYAIENKFPVAYPTVDIAVVKYDSVTYDHQLLLGRKSEEGKYCFIGGFVDPADESKELAASRELSEEVKNMDVHEFKYVSSHKIYDRRYYGTKDGIITSFFITYYLSGTPSPADDICEVKWFDLKGFDKDILSTYHHVLYDSLVAYLAEKQYCSYHEETKHTNSIQL